MRTPLTIFSALVLAAMIALTTVASLDRNLVLALEDLWPDPWFRATLADTYFAFLTVYLWVAYREPGAARKLLWLLLFLGLGSIAIAAYLLLQIGRLERDFSAGDLLLRPGQRRG